MTIPHADIDRNSKYLANDCPGILTRVAASAYYDILECGRCGFCTTIRNTTPRSARRTDDDHEFEAGF